MKNFSVAIDGPAGSGKSTVAKQIALLFNIAYIDTGAMYRTVALYCINKGIDTKNEYDVLKEIDNINMDIRFLDGEQQIFLNGENVGLKIRSKEVGKGSSDVAVFLKVREKLIDIQRKLAENQSVIMDGRDIGTNVLKNADIKIYLDASVEERAERRKKELELNGESCDIDDVKNMIKQRDKNDMNRKYNPLKCADDAILIDTTGKQINEVVKIIADIIKLKIKE